MDKFLERQQETDNLNRPIGKETEFVIKLTPK